MTAEEYQLLLWVLGDQVAGANMFCLALVAAWYGGNYIKRKYQQMLAYLDYRTDMVFWDDVLRD